MKDLFEMQFYPRRWENILPCCWVWKMVEYFFHPLVSQTSQWSQPVDMWGEYSTIFIKYPGVIKR